MISINPFKAGSTVTDEYFTDREEEIKTLLLDLKSGQNVILYSPRRFGKTSLILKVISHLKKEDCLCIYVDLFPISSKKRFAEILASVIAKGTSKRVEEVARKIKNFLPNIFPKIVLKGEGNMEFDLEFGERELDIEKLLTSLYDLPQNIASKRRKRIVMVFDEFQQIGQIDGEEIEKNLRSKIQHHNDVSYIFMGSKRHLMERIFNDKSRPFYKIGKTFTLRKIPKDKFTAFIESRLQETGIEIESTLIEKILKITDGHPYYTQMLMHEIWDESYSSGRITQESIQRGIEQVFLHQEYEFIAIWDPLPPKQKNLLIALADDENILIHSQSAIMRYELGSPATVSKSSKILVNKGILEQERRRFTFSDIFFKEWIKGQGRYPGEDTLIEKIVAPEKPLQFPLLPALHNQTPPEPNFVGRVEMLSTITGWYKDPKVRIGALIGWGGVGKSALVRKWYDGLSENNIQPDGIFWWGFYGNAYLEAFLNALLRYVSQGKIDPETIKNSYEKTERIKEYLHQASYLIILDGLEEMQKGEEFGCLAHREFIDLLKFIADVNKRGLCLITTRYPLRDIENYEATTYQNIEVEHLEPDDARLLFRKVGIKGEQNEIDKVIKEYDGHALSLTLLCGHIVEKFNGDIKKAGEIPPFHSDKEAGGKAHRILLWYESQLNEEQQVFLKIFSIFRRDVTERDFEGVFRSKMGMNQCLVDMPIFSFMGMVDNLCARRMITKGQNNIYTTHPLIKNYFESIFDEENKRLCHKHIYQYIGSYTPEKPGTLDEMQPLFEQVYHGCSAGLYDEVFNTVYWEKINGREECFITHKLSAWETNLSLIRAFYPKGDLSQLPLVSKKSDQSWLLNAAGLTILSMGRLKEAEEPSLTAIKIAIEVKDWENASRGYQNLTTIQSRAGEIDTGLLSAQKALEVAEKAKSYEHIINSKAYLSWVFHLLGNTEEAEKGFKQADELSKKIWGHRLNSLRGVWYADFLISIKRTDEALEITQRNLEICERNNWPADILGCHRAISAIERTRGNHKEAYDHLHNAFEFAKKVGMPFLEIEVLLESGRLHLDTENYQDAIYDANQVLKLCDRTGFLLYEPDAELILAKAYLAQNDPEQAKSYANSAYKKATSMHYHLPKVESAQILEKWR